MSPLKGLPEMLTAVARETTQLRYAGATSDVARNVLKLGGSDVFPDVRGSALKALIVVAGRTAGRVVQI